MIVQLPGHIGLISTNKCIKDSPGRAVHVPLLFPIGMLVGLGISIGYIIHRFGRQQGVERPRKEITGDR